ncbi:hypothetical protein BJX61DRAFT_546063 [Aspergillus egyptiacus]|nr:hypothetical protein BJX61DRAFT_546063 [Aspergillus egyptiacus]
MSTYQLQLGICHEVQDRGARWIVILVYPDGHPCMLYSCTGGPHTGDAPYAREKAQKPTCFPGLFAERRTIGTVQEDNLDSFNQVFELTEPGPNQFFVVRFLYECVKRGIVEDAKVLDVLSKAEYTAVEWEHFHENYAPVDLDFLTGFELAREIGPVPKRRKL